MLDAEAPCPDTCCRIHLIGNPLESQCDTNGLSFVHQSGTGKLFPTGVPPNGNGVALFVLCLKGAIQMKNTGFHKGLKALLQLVFGF